MSLKDELKALQRKCEGDACEFQDRMEKLVAFEVDWHAEVILQLGTRIQAAKDSGREYITFEIPELGGNQVEVILFIEEWLERDGSEFNFEDEWRNGKKITSLHINLAD